MRKLFRSAVIAATLLTTVGVSAGAAAAAAAPAAVSRSVAPMVVCEYIVAYNAVPVFEYPDPASHIVRVKYAGDVVTGPLPCAYYVGAGYHWYKLILAGGGYGYIMVNAVE